MQVPWLKGFYSLPDSVGIAGCEAYKQGRLYGVDAASGAAVMALAPRPGEHVLDLCAAPGTHSHHPTSGSGTESRCFTLETGHG
jgi:16S rRNA C967 or C1407 C5-methylase (RsmB/RsmF family)